MLGRKTKLFAYASLLSLWIAQSPMVKAQGEDVAIAGERETVKVERIVATNEMCSEEHGRYRLAVSNARHADELYFRFENLSASPIYVYLMRDGQTYWVDYPTVKVFYKPSEGETWRAPVMNPGTYVSDGLERISVDAGASIVFRAKVSAYLPRSAKIVKLQLRFGTSPDGMAACACVSSIPFMLPARE